jgi:3-oxoacyl-[acyl-carrier protein] reductase
MRLKGKVALVAGAGRNNGRAISLAFAREGADLILIAKERDKDLKQVARDCESLGVQTLPLLGDVSSHEQANHLVQQGTQRFGKVDVLMCVAGVRPGKPFWEIDYDEWLQVFAVNLHSTFYLAKAVTPGMTERKCGSIIALGGTASLTSAADRAHVVASKHGLYGLTKALALELGPYGIRANLLCPAKL